MYSRQLAWFHSAPTEKPGREKPATRLQRVEQTGGEPLFPDVEAEYLLGYWHSLGCVQSGSMGPMPLTSTEIDAWQRNTGIELNAWEVGTISEMSRAYVGQSRESEEWSCPPPYGVPMPDRGFVDKQLRGALSSMTQPDPRRKRKR